MFLFIVGNLVLMNLFLAILLSNFEPKDDEEVSKDEEEDEDSSDGLTIKEKLMAWLLIKCPCCFKR